MHTDAIPFKYLFHSDPFTLCSKGDVKKTLRLFITDDEEPEGNETLIIGLVGTEGGSRILPGADSITILILANDFAAGVVGFSNSSRSVITHRGRFSRRFTILYKDCECPSLDLFFR